MNTDSQPVATSDLALLGLMQLVSPALPIGAFAWSQGLESAFELGWVKTEADLREWLEGVLEDGLSRCELPLLARLCYHLGNRHVSLAIGEDKQGGWIRFPPDHVLEELAEHLGATLVHHNAKFDPEPGAYSPAGHSHEH